MSFNNIIFVSLKGQKNVLIHDTAQLENPLTTVYNQKYKEKA